MGIKMVRTKIKMRSRLLVKGIAVIIFGAFAMGLICNNSAHAAGGGWAGISNVPVSTNPPDAESTGGSGDGFSWIYYQSTGVATGDITFGSTYDFIYNSASYPATISGTCSTKNNGVNGGFWHYGLNDQARLGKEWNGETFYYFGQFTNSGHAGYTPMRYTTGENGWGHMITIPYGYYDRAEKTKGNLNHAIYDSAGLIKLYEAKMSNLTNDTNILMPDGKTYSMLEMFNISYSYMDEEGEEGTDTEIPRGTYAFCFYGRIENDFLGESIASASSSDGSSGSTTTGIVGMGSQTDAENVVVTAKKDDTVTIEFRHNMYSTLYNRRAYWLVDRPNTSGFNVVSSELARANRGTDRFGTPKENNYYTPRTGNSVLIDKYTIKFTEKGSYTFCEDLKIDRSYNAVESVDYASKACVTVDVDGGGSSGGGGGDLSDVCEKFKPSSFNDGYSSVVSKIKNERFGGWEDLIYAKPTDRIQWLNCYYPGAQLNYNATITISHGPPSGSSCPTDNKPFSSAYSFTNQYEVKTDSPFGMNNNSWSKNESYISNTFKPFSLDLGATNAYKKEAQNNYVAERDKVGNTYTDTIKISAGVPIYTKVWEDKHEWTYTVPKTCWGAYPVPVPDGNGGTTIDWAPYPYDCSYEETASHPVYEYEYSASTLPNEPSDIATVKIPYNFENEVSFSMSGQNADGVGQVVYAGEVVNVGSFVLNVKPRTNTVTEANYATIVRDAQVKLIAYVTEDNSGVVPFSNGNCSGGNYIECNIAQEYSGSLNFNSNYANKKDTLNGTNYSGSVEGVSFVGDYKVFDAKAGTQFCMAVAVYPANSGDPKNMEAKGNGEWAVSSPQCIVVAKKPSFQIWGNGIYSVNGIDALASEKHNVYGVYNETSPLVSGGVVFGSWVEQSIIVRNGTVTKVASGAAMGKDNSGNQINYGWKGNIGDDFCSMVPLTFTNCIGNSKEAGKSGIDPPTTNVSALVDYWGDGDATGFYDGASLNGAVGRAVVSATGKDIRILETDADIRIGFSQIDANKTRIVKAHDVTIDDVIQYTDGSYTALSALPKVIIYAKNNITIGCNVGRVDAVLIAEGTVYSCGNYQGTGTVFEADENSARSHQLIINGAVIANNIELGRTYGNSFGIGSGSYMNPTTPGSETPAEILNYDASILLWGESMASAENSNTLTVTYQHELAPRY